MASMNSSVTNSQQPPLSANYPYASSPPFSKFNPSMEIVIVTLASAFIFVAFFIIYVRKCTNAPVSNPRPLQASSRPKGLDKSVVESLPVVRFKDLNFEVDEKVGAGQGKDEEDNVHRECAVCLSEFQTEDSLRLLPECKHVFHLECIDVWFRSHSTCPLCRASLLPTKDCQQVHDAGEEDQAESVVIEEEVREGDRGQGVSQVQPEVVVTIVRNDAGGGARNLEPAQPAVPVASIRSGIATEDDPKDTAWFTLFRNIQRFKKAARVVLHERAGTSPGPNLEAQTNSKTRKAPSPINEPMQQSTSLDGDGKSMKDFFSSDQSPPRAESQHSVPAALILEMMNLPTTSNPDFQQTGSYSELEFLRAGSLNSVEKTHLTESQPIRSNSEHWVSIKLDEGLESFGVGPSRTISVQQLLSDSPIISRETEIGRLER